MAEPMSAGELRTVLKWLDARVADIHKRVDEGKQVGEDLWASGLLEEKWVVEECRQDVLDALAQQEGGINDRV